MKTSYCSTIIRAGNSIRRGGGVFNQRHIVLLTAAAERWPRYMMSTPPSHPSSSYSASYFSSMPQSSYYQQPPPPSSSSKSFKKVIRPFLRACHPDAMMGATDAAKQQQQQQQQDANSSMRRQRPTISQQAKDTNLKAVQTINGLIDVLDDLIDRCTPPMYKQQKQSNKSTATLPELNAQYEIEFILPPSNNNNFMEEGKIKRKRRDKVALTSRSITISFPEQLRTNVRQWALTSFPTISYDDEPSSQEEKAFHTAIQLKDHAMSELLRLLAIAGMDVPTDVMEQNQQQQDSGRTGQQQQQQRKDEKRWTISDHFLDELGIDPMEDNDRSTTNLLSKNSGAYFGRTQSQPSSPFLRQQKSTLSPPPTYSHPHLQRQRETFMSSIQWNKFAQDYDQAFLDAQADYTTTGLDLYNVNTQEGRERREQLVSQICGKVRIWRATKDSGDSKDTDIDDDIPEGLDVVAQLIAIRRLSLLLYDNFDYLKFEKMGRMYENLTLVLTPPRNLQSRTPRRRMVREDGTPLHPGRKLTKWERRKRRRDKLQTGSSRGKMRYIAEKYLGKKDTTEDEDDSSTNKEKEDKSTSSPYLSESGFKFSYGTQSDQGIGQVTAYIPVDFRDGELIRQMYTHLYDYFDNVCGHVGFLRYGADGTIDAPTAASDDTNSKGSSDQKEKRMSREE